MRVESQRKWNRLRWGWPAALTIILATAYGFTLAPGLTWANRGDDGGDLITAAATLGVAHPTGYPTYLILAHLFQWLPFGSLAFRATLLSSASALGAALAVRELVLCLRPADRHAFPSQLAGWCGGLAFGLSALVWSQAVIAEVYTLHALGLSVILLATYRLINEDQRPLGLLDRIYALAIGLALGNHLTTLFALPVYLGALWYRRQRAPHAPTIQLLGLLLAGTAIYLYLPIRAAAQPPVNWGQAFTVQGFWWVVSGAPYHPLAFAAPADEIWPKMVAGLRQLLDQWNWPGLLLGLLGMAAVPVTAKGMRLALLWLALVAFAFAVEYNAKDYFVHLLPVCLSLAVGIGLAVGGGMDWAARRSARLALSGTLAIAAWLAVQLVTVGPRISARADARAEDFLEAVLAQAPRNALIATRTDRDSFALWYGRFALRARPDVMIVVEPMLPYAWYRENLRATYAHFVAPDDPKVNADRLAELNGRPLCRTDLEAEAPLRCAEGYNQITTSP